MRPTMSPDLSFVEPAIFRYDCPSDNELILNADQLIFGNISRACSNREVLQGHQAHNKLSSWWWPQVLLPVPDLLETTVPEPKLNSNWVSGGQCGPTARKGVEIIQDM